MCFRLQLRVVAGAVEALCEVDGEKLLRRICEATEAWRKQDFPSGWQDNALPQTDLLGGWQDEQGAPLSGGSTALHVAGLAGLQEEVAYALCRISWRRAVSDCAALVPQGFSEEVDEACSQVLGMQALGQSFAALGGGRRPGMLLRPEGGGMQWMERDPANNSSCFRR